MFLRIKKILISSILIIIQISCDEKKPIVKYNTSVIQVERFNDINISIEDYPGNILLKEKISANLADSTFIEISETLNTIDNNFSYYEGQKSISDSKFILISNKNRNKAKLVHFYDGKLIQSFYACQLAFHQETS
jgi:hypothetical protein